MSAFEDRLAELLSEEKARIEEAVALVQRAADAWVESFRHHAGALTKDPRTQTTLLSTPTAIPQPPKVEDETPTHMRVPETAQAVINGMVGRQWRAGDEDAINANMKI